MNKCGKIRLSLYSVAFMQKKRGTAENDSSEIFEFSKIIICLWLFPKILRCIKTDL